MNILRVLTGLKTGQNSWIFTNFETLGHGFSIYDGGGTPVLWRWARRPTRGEELLHAPRPRCWRPVSRENLDRPGRFIDDRWPRHAVRHADAVNRIYIHARRRALATANQRSRPVWWPLVDSDASSASEVTTLWRYTNLFVIIIIIKKDIN